MEGFVESMQLNEARAIDTSVPDSRSWIAEVLGCNPGTCNFLLGRSHISKEKVSNARLAFGAHQQSIFLLTRGLFFNSRPYPSGDGGIIVRS